MLVDAQGRKVSCKHNVEPTALFIHSAIHRGRTDAACVMHTHMPHATALTVVHGGQLEWAIQHLLKFCNRCACDEQYNELALDEAEGELMCALMQDAVVPFLCTRVSSHGARHV